MAFQEYRREKREVGQPKIMILARGTFWVSASAVKKYFQNFDGVVLLFDPDRRVIGLRPTKGNKNAYSLSGGKGRKDRTFSARSFLKHYGAVHGETRSYRLRWNSQEQLVELNLNDPI